MQSDVINKKILWIEIIVFQLLIAVLLLLYPNYYFAAAVVSIFFMAFIFSVPEISLFLVVFTISVEQAALYLILGSNVVETFLIYHVFAVIAFISSLAALTLGNKRIKSLEKDKFFFLYLLFFLWGCLTLFWSADRSNGYFKTYNFVIDGMMIVSCYLIIKTKRYLNWLIGATVAAGVITTVIALYSMGLDYPGEIYYNYRNLILAFTFNPRPEIMRGHGILSPPATAFYLNTVISYTFAVILLCRKKIIKFIMFVVLMFLFTGHLSTITKGSLLGLLAIATVFIFRNEFLKKRIFTSYLVMLSLILFGFLASHIDDLSRTIEFGILRTMSTSSGTTSVSYRMMFWKKGIVKIFETYGIGVGMGGMQHEFYPWPHSHSIYFSTLYDLGFTGLIIWLAILGYAMKKSVDVYRVTTDKYYRTMILAFIANLSGILVNGLTDFEYVYGMIWLQLAFGMAIVRLAKKNGAGIAET
ncbi:MAG: O-antigen ligase family protein [Candidatus Schekmanbacteria bacterium]|nr:O-antigen ligase family protein [Candidatus Schekmanbacteria bacterium]